MFYKYKRPVCIIGSGANRKDMSTGVSVDWLSLCEQKRIPIIKTWGGFDKLRCDHPLNCGGFGVVGGRLANKIVQNADGLFIFGSELNQQITGNPEWFARKALRLSPHIETDDTTEWWDQINEWKKEPDIERLNWDVCPYKFFEELNKHTSEGDIVVTDAGGNLCWTMQNIKAKKNMRIFSAWNHSPMGYSLPAAIGAQLAAPSSRVICIIGDGGLMMCLQELATVVRHQLPVKIFLFNNEGQGIQRQTMETWLNGRMHGESVETGLGFPNWREIANSFGLAYDYVHKNVDTKERLEEVFACNYPVLCEVMIDPKARIVPMLKAGQRLENL